VNSNLIGSDFFSKDEIKSFLKDNKMTIILEDAIKKKPNKLPTVNEIAEK